MSAVDQGAEGLFSPFLRRRRQSQVRPLLRGRVLDFGCGGGQLAADCDPADYLGYDRDAQVLELARKSHPAHSFTDRLPPGESFDTVVMLAVLEHLPEPGATLGALAGRLAADGRIVGTTPHPAFAGFHAVGARIGLFSCAASEEHERLLDRRRLAQIGRAAGLELSGYRRFLVGANQLFVYSPLATARGPLA